MQNMNDTLNAKLDLLEGHAEHLARMKGQGKSTSDMLAWLRTQGITKVHGGHLAALWKRHETTQPSRVAPLPCEVRPSPQRGEGGPRQDEVKPPETCAASPASDPDLDCLMDQYRKLLSKLLDQALADPSPENVKQVNSMITKVIKYDLGLVNSHYRERSLKLKEASQELKNRTPIPPALP